MAKLGLSSGDGKVGPATIVGIIAAAAAIALAAGYAVHKLRLRRVMQNEIRDIMCALLSLDPKPSQGPVLGPCRLSLRLCHAWLSFTQLACIMLLPSCHGLLIPCRTRTLGKSDVLLL